MGRPLDFPGANPVRIAGDGLVLREWTGLDAGSMPVLFDDAEVARWTPLASPFDLDAATAYLEQAAQRRAEGFSVQLAITVDGGTPLGEVLLFPREDVVEVGWGLGPAHRGRGTATRAVRLVLRWLDQVWGIREYRALIEPGNDRSANVARACGFVETRGVMTVQSRGRPVPMAVWRASAWSRSLPSRGRAGSRFGLE